MTTLEVIRRRALAGFMPPQILPPCESAEEPSICQTPAPCPAGCISASRKRRHRSRR